MKKMHEHEFEINENLVQSLLTNQCLKWSNLPLRQVISSGTDNALFRLGNEYIIRLPRIEWSPGSINQSINKEYEWVPKIAQLLKTLISEPIFKGNPDKLYPWAWTINKWNEGQTPDFEKENEYELLAKDLAEFLNELHSIRLPEGPYSRRGVSIKEINEETIKAINSLKGDIDTQKVFSLWEQLINVPLWNKDPVWVHGDFLPGNILIKNNRLSAVIDFTEVGIGDPACDLIIAWSLFNENSRKIFKANLKNIDENTWKRGIAWALSIALIMLPYYKNSNPVLIFLSKRMINNIFLHTPL